MTYLQHARSWLFKIALCAIALSLNQCRTVREDSGSSSASASLSKETPGLAASLRPARNEEQALYLQMLAVELQSGVKVAKEHLHSVAGLVECRRSRQQNDQSDDDEAPARCSIRVRLDSPSGSVLSAAQPLEASIEAKTSAFAASFHPDLARAPLVLANVTCDYIGKKSPPYAIEETVCQIAYPRLPHEVIFDSRLGEELAELARSNAAFGEGTVTITGALQCRLVEASDRPACMVRPGPGGVLLDKVLPLSGPHAAIATRALLQAASDRAQIGAGASKTTTLREASAMLKCEVDSSRLASGGQRVAICRASL